VVSARHPVRRPTALVSAAASLGGLLVPLAVFVVAAPKVVDGLGRERFGVLMVVVAVTSLVTSMDLGLGAGGVRLVARAAGRGDMTVAAEVVREVFTVFAGLAVLVAGIGLLLGGPLSRLLFPDTTLPAAETRQVVTLAAMLAAVAFVGAGTAVLPRGMEAMPFVSGLQGLYSSAIWLGAWGMVALGKGLVAILVWIIATNTLLALAFAVWGLYHCPDVSFRPTQRLAHLRGAIAFNAFAFCAQINAALVNSLDKLLISFVLGPVSVAHYSLVSNIAAKLPMVAAALAAFVYPRAAHLSIAAANAPIQDLYLKVSRYLTLMLAPLTVLLLALAPPALDLWMGEDFAREMTGPTLLLVTAYAIATVSVVPSLVFNALGNSRIGALFSGIAVLLTAAGSVALIAPFGILGVALGVLIGMLQGVAYAGLLERSLGLGWFRSRRPFLVQVAACLAAEAIVLLLLRGYVSGWASLVAIGALGGGAFFVAWVAFGFATAEDRALVQRMAHASWPRKSSN
jgi:O-antigen/teichoic acid export membrane protein